MSNTELDTPEGRQKLLSWAKSVIVGNNPETRNDHERYLAGNQEMVSLVREGLRIGCGGEIAE